MRELRENKCIGSGNEVAMSLCLICWSDLSHFSEFRHPLHLHLCIWKQGLGVCLQRFFTTFQLPIFQYLFLTCYFFSF